MNKRFLVVVLLVIMAVAALEPALTADPMLVLPWGTKYYRNLADCDVVIYHPDAPLDPNYTPGTPPCVAQGEFLCPARSVTIFYGLASPVYGEDPPPEWFKPQCELRVPKSRDVDAVVTLLPPGWSASGTGAGSDTVVFSTTTECVEPIRFDASSGECVFFGLTVYDVTQGIKYDQLTVLDDSGNVGAAGGYGAGGPNSYFDCFISSCPPGGGQ